MVKLCARHMGAKEFTKCMFGRQQGTQAATKVGRSDHIMGAVAGMDGWQQVVVWSIFVHATWALKIPQNVDLDHNWAHKLPPKLVVVPIWRGAVVEIDVWQPGHNLVNLYAGTRVLWTLRNVDLDASGVHGLLPRWVVVTILREW